jgi:FkbM family methyltransferase
MTNCKKNNVIEKIFWRIKFILFESYGKNIEAIIYSLKSARKRGGDGLAGLLLKRGIIDWDKEQKLVVHDNTKIYYIDYYSLTDLVAISLYDEAYVRKNFWHNSSILLEGPYENNEVKLKRNDYVIDAGANVGVFSIEASRKIGERGRLYAFEPNQEAFNLLAKNIENNSIRNVYKYKIALGDSNDDLDFYIFNENGGANSGFFKSSLLASVPQTTLDRFMQENKIPRVDFIKADIEGMERNLLLGAEATIKKFHPRISICLYHRPDDAEVLEKLIKQFSTDYKIIKTKTKLYAY